MPKIPEQATSLNASLPASFTRPGSGSRHASDQRSAHLLLIHGLNSTPQEFGLIEFALRSRKLSYDVLTLPGYTGADPNQPVSWRDWLDEAAAAVAVHRRPDRPLVLGGLCMGGMLAAALLTERRCQADGLILLSPSVRYDGWGLSPWLHLRHLGYLLQLGRHVKIAEREPYGIKNAKIRKWVAQEMQERAASAAGPSSLPLWAVHEGERLIRAVRRRLPELRQPTLMLHAREDEITRLDSVQQVFDTMQAERELIVLENCYHMITIDNDRQRVVDEMLRFCNRFGSSECQSEYQSECQPEFSLESANELKTSSVAGSMAAVIAA